MLCLEIKTQNFCFCENRIDEFAFFSNFEVDQQRSGEIRVLRLGRHSTLSMKIGKINGFALTLIITLLSFAIIFILAFAGWPGNPHYCIEYERCYCETLDYNKMFLQPVNTWTNLSAVIMGLYIAYELSYKNNIFDPNDKLNNPMDHPSFYSMLYANLVVFIGTSSFLFHGAMTDYGGAIDNIAMNGYILFLILYEMTQMFGLSKQHFIGILILLLLPISYFSFYPHFGRASFMVLVIIAIPMEIFIQVMMEKHKIMRIRNRKLLIWSILIFGIAYLFWDVSKTGAVFCYPESLWQGHGVWHILVGIAPFLIYRYLRSEKAIEKT